MKRVLVDVSSVLGQMMHLPDEEYGEDVKFNGKTFHIPSLETSMEKAEAYFQNVLNRFNLGPESLIMVRDPENSGTARKRRYPFYKATREERPPQFYKVFNALVDGMCNMVMEAGGIMATPRVSPAVEADDLINELAICLKDTMIWSVDKDLLACPAGMHFIGGEVNPIKFPVPQKFIRLYRSIVTGDPSDNIPGCKGFGQKAWEKMLEVIGPDGIEELEDIIAKRELDQLDESAFPKASLLKEKAEDIYASYDLMGFERIKHHKIKWESRIGEYEKTLVTADNFAQLLPRIKREIAAASHVTIDYETDVPEADASEAWKVGTADESGKGGVNVDVIASEIAGMGMLVENSAYYFSVHHHDTNNISLKDLLTVLKLIGGKRTFAHNSTGFENIVTYNSFGFMLEGMADTRLMASYVDENSPLGLKPLSKRWLEYTQETYDQVLAKARERNPDVRGMFDVTGAEVLSYGIDDVLTCNALQNLFSAIMETEGTLNTFYEVEQQSAFVTSLAVANGFLFNQEAYEELKQENDANIHRAKAELGELLLAVGFGESCPVTLMCEGGLAPTKVDIQRVYRAVTGEDLVTKARTSKSIVANLKINLAAGLEPKGVDELVQALEAPEQCLQLKELYHKHWRPIAELNVRSPKQVQTLLYDILGCPVRVRNKVTEAARARGEYQGSPSTDDDAIGNAIAYKDTSEEGVATLEKLLEYKGFLTRESLFLSKWPRYVHWKTGRIHGSIAQCGTSTRRFSHSAPNVAQLPKRKGREVRKLIKADEDWYIVAFDFESQELKLAAWDCQDENFLSAYTGEEKKDIHSMTGFQVAQFQGVEVNSLEEFVERLELDEHDERSTKKLRADGKATNFSSQFLCQAERLSIMLRVPVETAQGFLDAKAAAFPGLMPRTEEWISLCSARGYAETFMGARRHLARDFASSSRGEQSKAGRLSYSFRIQGSAAEQTKMAMKRSYANGLYSDRLCFPVTIIHDELVILIHKSVLAERIKDIHACVIAQYADMAIAAGSTPEAGHNFCDLKKWDIATGDFKKKETK